VSRIIEFRPNETHIEPTRFRFSFGVMRSDLSPYVIQYKLLGIQYEWDKDERYIPVTAIKHWCDPLRAAGVVVD